MIELLENRVTVPWHLQIVSTMSLPLSLRLLSFSLSLSPNISGRWVPSSVL